MPDYDLIFPRKLRLQFFSNHRGSQAGHRMKEWTKSRDWKLEPVNERNATKASIGRARTRRVGAVISTSCFRRAGHHYAQESIPCPRPKGWHFATGRRVRNGTTGLNREQAECPR